MSRLLSAVLIPALLFGARLRLLRGMFRHRKLIKRTNGYRMIDLAELENIRWP